MALTPVSYSEFGTKRFKRNDSYAFAAKDAMAPLVFKEFVPASMAMPIGFTKAQDTFIPVAVLGLGNQTNLFVAPDGRWVGRYVPLAYRHYPFVLANGPEKKQILCFEDSSGLLTDKSGEPFFTEDAKPTDAINEVLNSLTQLSASRQATSQMCSLLAAHELIEPWPIKLKNEPESPEQILEGLYRINQNALNALTEKPLHALHRFGALPMIYCQLLSMQHLSMLGEFARARQLAEQHAALPKNKSGEIDLSFLADDTTISFDNL